MLQKKLTVSLAVKAVLGSRNTRVRKWQLSGRRGESAIASVRLGQILPFAAERVRTIFHWLRSLSLLIGFTNPPDFAPHVPSRLQDRMIDALCMNQLQPSPSDNRLSTSPSPL